MTIKRSFLHASLALALPGVLADAATAPAPRISTDHSSVAIGAAVATDHSARVSIQRAVDAVYPALVRIHVVVEEGDGGRMQKRRASGSGTIIDEEGHILTNHHVAGRATRIVCRLSNREEVDATLVGTDPLSDLAVLKLDLSSRRNPKARLPVARFGNSDKLKVGDTVLAMGSPAGLSQSVTEGIVANTAMISPGGAGGFVLDGERIGELVRWIGHDAVIFPGNSGGPLVNLKGEIIGVNEVGIGSLGGAIPANVAKSVAHELIAKGSVSRSWIGLEVQPLLKNMAKESGVLVANVLAESPAKKAGLLPGDFITNYNGASVPDGRSPEDIPVFNRLVLATPVGAKVTLKGVRAGHPMTWQLATVLREPNEAREVELPNWGMTARDFTRVSALENQRKNKNGVIVDGVRPGGATAESKPALRPEDIITKVGDKMIANVEALNQFTKEFTKRLTEPKPVTVTFERDTQELITVAKIGPEIEEDRPGRPAKAWLGVQTQVLTSDLAEALGLEGKKGVRVTQVLPESPAQKQNIQVGDILLKLDGQVIAASTPSDQELFDNLIRQYKVASAAEFEGVRGGQPLKLAVKLGKQPKPAIELDEFKDERFEFTARDLSFTDRVNAKLAESDQAVRIGSVQTAGWAALAGLSSGDILLSVDGERVESVNSLKGLMHKLYEAKPRRVVFFIKRGIRTMFAELEPKW